jgi:glycosyltransferase involved in cell wall biosynthesis
MNKAKPIHICLFGDERSIHTRRWVGALRDCGHRVDIITLNKDPGNDIGGIYLNANSKLNRIIEIPPIKAILRKVAPQIYHSHQIGYQEGSKLDYFAKIKPLKALIRNLNPDIFHAHQASSYGFLASFVEHPRKVLSVWGDDVIEFPKRNFLYKAFIKRSISSAYHITATSHFLKEIVIGYSRPAKDITVVPFGVDLNRLYPVTRASNKVVRIGIVKWLTYKYGIDILIKAFDKVIKSGYQAELIIAGRGPSEDDFKRLAAEFKLQDKVVFHGYVEPSKLQDFLAAIDIFTMPSITDGESFGVAALEASATCLPVVATRVGGVPEVVKDGETGILVERGSVSQLAEALIKLIESPELRLKMGLAGRTYVEQNYRWQDNVASMEKLYQDILR